MGKEADVRWLTDPDEHDYPAAESYLRRMGSSLAQTTQLEDISND